MLKCRNCGKEFSILVNIDGKIRNLCNRKYCLECSPYGNKNRKILETATNICLGCGIKLKDTRRHYCGTCISKKQRYKVAEKIYSITGDYCAICNYGGKDKRSILDFHHVDPSKKLFCVNLNTMGTKSFNKIINEVKKCLLLCCRCHREYDAGLISVEKIQEKYIEFWNGINDKQLII